MRIFHSEVGRSGDTFSFAYYPTALFEAGDRLADLYEAGFLPFSTPHTSIGSVRGHGRPGLMNSSSGKLFFMARQVRIDLQRFALSSENRRVYRKFSSCASTRGGSAFGGKASEDGSGKFDRREVPLAQFDTHNQKFVSFCLRYFAERHGPEVMPEERLRFMLDGGLISSIIEYTEKGNIAAYIFLVADPVMVHFWYSFYDLAYVQQSLGLWLMIDTALQMQRARKRHLYLGTAFGEKGLYKTNFDQIEWWDGEQWCVDRDKLRKRCETDDKRMVRLGSPQVI